MPDNPQDKTKSVLQDFIATKNNNPGMDSETLKSKFPEISQFAALNQVSSDDVVGELDSYYNKYRSGKFGSVDELNADSPFFFSQQQVSTPSTANVTPTSTESLTPAEGLQAPVSPQIQEVVPQSQSTSSLSDNVLQEFLATKNDNPGISDDEIRSKFPEVSNYSIETQQNSNDVMGQLNQFYNDYRSGEFESFDQLSQKYNFSGPLKKKEETTLLGDQTVAGPLASESEDTLSVLMQDPNPENNILSKGLSLTDENGRLLRKGSLLESINQDRIKEDPFENAKNFGEWDEQTFKSLQETRSKHKKDFNERVKSMDLRLDNIFRSTMEIDENDNINRTPEENYLVNDVVYGAELSLPEGINKEDYPTLFDDQGNPLRGVADRYSAVQRQAGNKYLGELASNSKKDFVKSLGLGSGEERDAAFSEKMGEISTNFLSEDDLKIKKLQDEVAELEKMPFPGRNADFLIELKQKKSQLKDLKNNRGLYDPETGEFISGNKDITTKAKGSRIQKFNDAVDQFQVAYEKTDLGKLEKKRDELYFRYKAFTEDFMLPNWDTAFTPSMKVKYVDSNGNEFKTIDQGPGERDLKAIVTYEDVENPGETKDYEVDLSTQRQRVKFAGGKAIESGLLVDGASNEWNDNMLERQDSLLAEYMAVNRILSLNIDPGQVEDVTFGEALVEGIGSSLGETSKSESALADKAINSLEEIGFSVTDEQKDKVDKTFTQKAGGVIGSSIPASIEIGAQIMLGNKALGIAKIGKAIETLSKGSKTAKFMLNMMAETAVQSAAFSRSGESGIAGAGEGIGQTIAGAALSRFGVNNKLINFGARLLAGAATETVAEFSGQFAEEMSRNGYDMDAAAEKTFGKTPDEMIEKVALTYVTGLALGLPGAGQESRAFLEEAYKEISNSDSTSPIVEHAKQFNIDKEFTKEDQTRLDEINEKVSSDQELSEDDTVEKSVLEVRKDITESPTESDTSAPVVSKNGGDTEYKFKEGESEGFASEEEVIQKLDEESFVNKVKSGEIELDLNNPSEEVEKKIEEKFPASESDTGLNIEETTPEVAPVEGEVAEEVTTTTPEVTEQVAEEVTTTSPEVTEQVAEEVDTTTDEKIETDETIEEDAKTEDKTLQTEESLTQLSEDVANVSEGVAPFSTKKVFDSTINLAENITEETGLKGAELITELKNRLSEKIGENFDPEDIDAISGEVTEAVKDIELKVESTPAASPESTIKEKSKSLADSVRKLKAPIDLGDLSSSPKPLLDAAWNTAVEATALTIEAGGNVAQAVSDGLKSIKQSEWYQGLSTEGKKAAEQQIQNALESNFKEQEAVVSEKVDKPTKKKPTKKQVEAKKEKKERKKAETHRQSRVALRHAKTLSSESEKKEILDRTKYKTVNLEETSKKIDELYNNEGSWEGAIDYVSDSRNKVDSNFKELVLADVGAKMESEGRRTGDFEMQKKGQSLIDEYSLGQTYKGQAVVGTKVLYERNPSLFWTKKIHQATEAKTRASLVQEYSPGETVGEAIESVRQEMQGEMDGLNEEITKLTAELEVALESAKKASSRQDNLRAKKEKTKEKRAKGFEKMKKALKGKGGTANAGLDPLLIEGILDVISSYIEEGVTNTRIIISKTYNMVKNAGGNLTKANIKNIAESLDEFNSARKMENVNTFYNKVQQLLNTKESVDASTIDSMVENPNSLWIQYQQNILSSVQSQVTKISNNAKATSEQKADLDKLSRSIAREINQKISEVSKSSKKRTKDVKSSKDIMIDLMANSDKVQEVYNGILSDQKVPVEVKNALMSVVDSEVVFSRTLVSNMINEEAKLSGKKLADVVASHYSGKERFVGDLAESITRDAGLNTEEAKFVSDFLKDKMDSIIQEKATKAVEKFLEKGINAEDIQSAINSGNVTEEIQKEIDKRIKTKESRKLIKRITKAVNLGALQDPRFVNSFADKFGFRDIDQTTKTKFHELVDEIEELRAPENTSKKVNGKEVNTFQSGRVEALEKELNTLIDTLSKKNFAWVAENLIAFKYLSILSGIATEIRAMSGAILGSGLNTFAFGMRNIGSMRGLLLGMANGFNAFKAASARATLARKTALITVGQGQGGFDLYASDKKSGASKSKLTGVERQMLRGWDKAMANFKKGENTKGILNTMSYALLQPLRMFHLLGASDAFFSTSIPQFIQTVQTYNSMAREMGAGPLQTFTGMGKKNNTNGGVTKMSLAERTQQAMNQDAESKSVFNAIAEEEYNKMSDKVRADMRKEGVSADRFEREFNKRIRKEVGGVKRLGNPKSTYKSKRVQELIENQNLKKFNYAVGMTKDWLLIGTPDGIAGIGAKKAQEFGRIDTAKDGGGKSLMKLLFQSNVMFLRLSANSWNQIKSGIPFLGALDAFLGYGVNPNTGEIITKGKNPKENFDLFLRGKYKADPKRTYQRLMVNAISTTAAMVIFQNMFEWDDDEGDYVLSEDRVIDVLGPGNMRQSKNKQTVEDFLKFSFSTTRDDDGFFSDYIRTNLSPQAQGLVAFLSAFSDDIKGLGGDKDIREREGDTGAKVFKGLVSNPFQAWWEGSFNSIGRMIKTGQGEETAAEAFMAVAQQIVMDNTKSLLQPAIYRDVVKYIQSETGGNQKSLDSFAGKFLNGFYGMDFMLEERTDMFGNKYPITSVVDEWIVGVEKMSDKHKEVDLMYKFEGGLEINPWRPSGFEKFGTFSFYGDKYESKSDEAQKIIIDKQQELFKDGVLDDYKYLNSIDNKDDLESEMKKIRKTSIEDAKYEVVDQLIKDGLVVEIKE